MSMDIFTLCGCAVVACVLIITVKQHRPDIATVLTVAAGIVLFAYIAADLHETVDQISVLTDNLGDLRDEAGIVVRALGVCLTSQLAADICRDSGLSTAAARVELGGRAAVLLMLLPVFSDVLEICTQMINI